MRDSHERQGARMGNRANSQKRGVLRHESIPSSLRVMRRRDYKSESAPILLIKREREKEGINVTVLVGL